MNLLRALFLFALLLPTVGTAQTDAKTALTILKEHALVVKLIVPQKKMEALLKANKKEEMLAVERETKMRHENLIQAFSTTYTFGPVYFIYTTNLGKLADGDPSVLFDKNGNSLKQIPTSWLFIELSESPDRGVNGFIVRDSAHYILTKPFPYFISQWGFLHLSTRTFPEMIATWQEKLQALEVALMAN